MIKNDFFHDGIKKATVLFGTLFNELRVKRYNSDGSELDDFLVPLEYGPREKALSRVENDPDLTRAYAVKLPRMSFELTGVSYDSSRKLSTVNSYVTRNDEDNKPVYRRQYQHVPYNLSFRLSIMAKSMDDAHKVVEQILPYFTPDWTLSANLLEDMPDRLFDIPIVLHTVDLSDTYEDDYTKRRMIIWTLDFTMKFMFFGPVSKAKVIKMAEVNFITDWTAETPIATVTVQPGLDANGNPTTVLNNSISYTQINETDNYDYIVTIEENK